MEPCVDEDVNRECYAGEQSHPPQVEVKKEEADIVYQNMDWNTNEELMAWVKNRALDNGYVVVTGRSKKKKGTDEVNKIWLVCDRGGEHNSTAILRRTGSKKIGCLFKLIGIYDTDSYGWKLQVRNDKHNHEPAQNLEGHPFVRRMSEQEQNMVHHLIEQHMEPRNILSSLKKQNPDNVSIRLSARFQVFMQVAHKRKYRKPLQGEFFRRVQTTLERCSTVEKRARMGPEQQNKLIGLDKWARRRRALKLGDHHHLVLTTRNCSPEAIRGCSYHHLYNLEAIEGSTTLLVA
ncbi:hypothetical protein E3N88_21904 [Mikania micrantha]|uniref:FAR1 domain-containing protein n=1 Tax=Mikania micrantha TaxID=192012 RepID=A0A5N6NAE4_9ASTR|nr:hypothetical protein E3N88_21904 [Mikania micrantha]